MSLKTPLQEMLYTEKCEHPVYYPQEPRSYLAWHEWAEIKSKTHTQKKCPHCHLYAIWQPKEKNERQLVV